MQDLKFVPIYNTLMRFDLMRLHLITVGITHAAIPLLHFILQQFYTW